MENCLIQPSTQHYLGPLKKSKETQKYGKNVSYILRNEFLEGIFLKDVN